MPSRTRVQYDGGVFRKTTIPKHSQSYRLAPPRALQSYRDVQYNQGPPTGVDNMASMYNGRRWDDRNGGDWMTAGLPDTRRIVELDDDRVFVPAKPEDPPPPPQELQTDHKESPEPPKRQSTRSTDRPRGPVYSFSTPTYPANHDTDSVYSQPKTRYIQPASSTYAAKDDRSLVTFNGLPTTILKAKVMYPNQAFAQGEGIGNVPVGKEAQFTVDTTRAGDAGIDVDIRGPSGRNVPCHVTGDGVFRCRYTPTEVGAHQVGVKFANEHIHGSPYQANVYDSGHVKVKAPEVVQLEDEATVQVNAEAAGRGRLEAEVLTSGHRVPCRVLEEPNMKYQIKFVPKVCMPHEVKIKYNEALLPGSPYKVKVSNLQNVFASGEGLGRVPVDRPASFTVDATRAGDPNLGVTAKVLSPSYIDVPCNVNTNGSGLYNCEYLPREVGDYSINVNYGTSAIVGSPFTSHAYHTHNVKVHNVPDSVMVDREVNFTVNAQAAGAGDVEPEVTCMGHRIHTNMTENPRGSRNYNVSFVPKMCKTHDVNVKFNGYVVPGCPHRVKVTDVSQVAVSGHGLNYVPVGKPAVFSVDATHAGEPDSRLHVTALGPDLREVPVNISGSGAYTCEYVPNLVGNHTISVTYGAEQVRGSPFTARAYDLTRVNVSDIGVGEVGKPMGFQINASEAGKGTLRSEVSCQGRQIYSDMKESPRDSGRYDVNFTPKVPEQHDVMVYFNNEIVPGCPLLADVRPERSPIASGNGLREGLEGRACDFTVDTAGCKKDKIDVQVFGPNAECNNVSVVQHADRVECSYVPKETGVHVVDITHGGKEIPGSPFQPVIVNPHRVSVIGGMDSILAANGRLPLVVSERCTIPLTTSQAGPGRMTSRVRSASRDLPVDVDVKPDGKHYVSFVPEEEGEHNIDIKWNDHHINRSPLIGDADQYAVDARRVELSGPGLGPEVKGSTMQEFIIDGSRAGRGSPHVTMNGPQPVDVALEPILGKKNVYKAKYEAVEPGQYQMNCLWSHKEVPGSPFDIQVYDSRRVTYAGPDVGNLGRTVKGIIDPRRAGKQGNMKVRCSGPSKRADVSLAENGDGTIGVEILPHEAGPHNLEIRCNDEPIAGSPFIIEIEDQPDASKVRVFGPGLQSGQLDGFKGNFLVDGSEAGPGELKIRVYGPSRDSFRLESKVLNEEDRKVAMSFIPKEEGRYEIAVNWSGEHVPGSPFPVIVHGRQDVMAEGQDMVNSAPPMVEPPPLPALPPPRDYDYLPQGNRDFDDPIYRPPAPPIRRQPSYEPRRPANGYYVDPYPYPMPPEGYERPSYSNPVYDRYYEPYDKFPPRDYLELRKDQYYYHPRYEGYEPASRYYPLNPRSDLDDIDKRSDFYIPTDAREGRKARKLPAITY
ncbi:PREDICTED: filamin-B-like [Branchiostoma belcheri]|uniref:Filamin-B-like n=1 Tax=Branchiostoma belcheri TaxID=7741 RepID=A0A6P5A839_BRABE|nr:PREDICTED: filamin-B-like [Branchiostoma belcheri]